MSKKFVFVEAMAKMIEMLEEWQENLNRRQTQIQARNLKNLNFIFLICRQKSTNHGSPSQTLNVFFDKEDT